MIDLNEPVRRSYSPIEQLALKNNFYLLVHSFLFFYLTLHNLVIPVAVNVFRGQFLLNDVHYWFLFHAPVFYWLKTKKQIPVSYILFLILGSIARLSFHSIFLYYKSWSIVSVYLSELSSLLFCFIIWSQVKKDKFMVLSLLGIIITPLFTQIEYTPIAATVTRIHKMPDQSLYANLGCKGSFLKFPNDFPRLSAQRLKLIDCGFETNQSTYKNQFQLVNESTRDINMRLYELKQKEGRYSWKFIRMKRMEQKSFWVLDEYLQKNKILLLKSPENRAIGLSILFPENPDLQGVLEINLDTLSWAKE